MIIARVDEREICIGTDRHNVIQQSLFIQRVIEEAHRRHVRK